MFAFFSRIFGQVIVGVCLSSFGLILMSALLSLRNLPRLFANLKNSLRYLLRFSFEFYAGILNRVRYYTGIDLLAPLPRTLTTVCISLLLGWGGAALIGFRLTNWMLALLALHGLFIGLAWEQILTPDDFQLGSREE